MKHSEYVAYLKGIGTAHVGIASVTRMIYVDWPFRNTKLEEFFSAQQSSPADPIYPMLVAESYSNKYRDNRGDNTDKVYDGGFMIMDTAIRGDFDDEDAKYDDCEQIAEEILAYMADEFEADYNATGRQGKRLLDLSSVQIEKIGAFADNVVGVRVGFNFMKNVAQGLIYDEGKFVW